MSVEERLDILEEKIDNLYKFVNEKVSELESVLSELKEDDWGFIE